jgi:glutamate racemase
VAAAIRQALPQERLLYFGDNAHIPYGDRQSEQILGFSEAITHALLEQHCKLIVIACNTASAAALKPLREKLPQVPFVGMEPAVKPAVEHTRTGVVGVIATVSTVQSELFATIVERFAQGVTVLQQACPGLVRRIEGGDLDSPVLEEMLHGWLDPMLEQHIDALVLGCTHYPLIRPVIERIVGPEVRVIDPAPAIARRVGTLLVEDQLLAPPGSPGSLTCYTSGDAGFFEDMLLRIGLKAESGVHAVRWQGDAVHLG